MTQRYRLASGGRIDRSKPLGFAFDGKRYQGYQGDTVASALLANGVRVVARSFKYHRPRGIVGSGAEEPNALLQLESGAYTVPNVRATQAELYEGLQARSVNRWPSLGFDVAGVNNFLSGFIPAGFYYKTFMWPGRFWRTYERFIRRASGFGVSPAVPDPDHYDKMHAHCDVLVVGAGPAGLAAALAAGRSGARVMLADEQSEPGGALLGRAETIDGRPALAWVADAAEELRGMEDVRVLGRSTVFGYYDHNFLGIAQRLTDHLPPGAAGMHALRQRFWRVRAKQVVIATGAIERPLVFCNNDRPGIMLASAVSTYVHRYAVAPGSGAVVFTNNDGAYATALDLEVAGVPVSVVDVRPNPRGELPERVRGKNIEIIAGYAVVDARAAKGVRSVEIMRLDEDGSALGVTARSLACDLVAVSGGWNPAVHLHSQSGARAVFDERRACFVPGRPVQAQRSAGACNGAFALADCLAEGFAAGSEAAKAAGLKSRRGRKTPRASDAPGESLQAFWVAPARAPVERRPKQFVDLQNDVSTSDIALAVREGYENVEHCKRYTLLGFGTDQGKLGNINGAAFLAMTLGNEVASTGTTTFRPPYTPVTFGAVAGDEVGSLYDPVRKTAMHEWHVQAGAAFEDVGQWKRPWYYPRAGESMHDAVNRECLAARNGVGVLDASTLGKIDVQGPDVAELLDRVYTNGWKKLRVGRCRYGLMLGEDGMVMDDGVTARLGEHHYLMTTTTGGAASVLAWLERWLQTEWPELKVHLTSVTDHWATVAVAGPKSRDVLTALCKDIDFSREAFPFMSFREGTVAGVKARVFRISFSGELAYEINVCANYGRHVWEAVMEAGEPYGITPYGTETMHVLRAEKGFVIVGQDTDGSVNPVDVGMEWILAKHKDFLGKRSLSRSDMLRGDRKQLVGLLTENPRDVLPEGAQLVEKVSDERPLPMLGHVTSSYYSACLGHSIALAMVKGGRARMDQTLYAPLADGRTMAARVARPVFYDPEGARQNV
ncbi:MAG: sarcosine oxidase subunit alpha family protein [Gammaproteobacteria bacterium]|nr:sarcosine oxidase subunit alpha family protein [Gammaproteobacteria bacterium]NIR81967.1 sarcosine oxidase subunit alpha family protein [Gammaproteobacteria bacterium]NIR89019.1 sarcosine oxidase subunit alpha family protein [Gammaproteobacteria bacterium]NIU03074.1 sarcosine oxidase subunit alpha family protein [Gammaproteobacteria bacterium]NIV50598.1 sarcosine oxidase subunit alpha family protein [Gammaproteobacteria bacterium]